MRRIRQKLAVGTLTAPNQREEYLFSPEQLTQLRTAVSQELDEKCQAAKEYEIIAKSRPVWTPADMARLGIPAMHFYHIAKKQHIPPSEAQFTPDEIINYFKRRCTYLPKKTVAA